MLNAEWVVDDRFNSAFSTRHSAFNSHSAFSTQHSAFNNHSAFSTQHSAMLDLLPTDPRARPMAVIVWAIGAVAGTIAVWWLSSYLDTLTALARTDREASLHLFRTRVLPALIAVVLVAVVSGTLLVRHGLRVMRSARGLGTFFACAGFVLASVPLLTLALVLWILRGA
jgi:hypothetical protein